MHEEPKINKMSKLRREVEFLERGMQRVRTKLKRLQQDATLTPSMSTVGLRPKQFVDQNAYHNMEQGNIQVTHDNDMYINPYSTLEQQIKSRCHFI